MHAFVAETAAVANPTRETPKVILPNSKRPSHHQILLGCYSPQNQEVEEFRGIPYATVCRRWEHSVLRDSLPQDVFDATRHGPRCPQPAAPNTTADFQSHLDFPADLEESEFDCLNLLVVRPSRTSLEQAGLGALHNTLPVYVYVHGGALAFGAGTDPIWDPVRLVAQAVCIKRPFIAVNINYRLNVFGFLASDILSAVQPHMKGCNFGLVDQARAIEWIAANIHAFGGNPENITIGGQSAGATSVYAHALRALHCQCKPLFRACIIQSPAAGICGPFAMTDANRRFGHLCEHLGLSSSSSEEKISKLRALSSTDILGAIDILQFHAFTLALDGVFLSSTMFSSSSTRDVHECASSSTDRNAREWAPMSVYFGITEMEASIFHEHVNKFRAMSHLMDSLHAYLPAADSQRLMEAYNFRHAEDTVSHDAMYLLLTDVIFGKPMQDAIEILDQLGASVSSYYFRPGNPFPGPFFGKAIHCVDLIYLYDCFYEALQAVDKQENGKAHRMLVQIMQANVIDFLASTTEPVANRGVLIYERDRTAALVDTQDHDGLRRRLARYKTLGSCWPEVQSFCADVVELDFSRRR